MIRRAAAWLNLAWRMAAHVAALPLRPFRGGGGERFLATVGPEGYRPLTPELRAHFPPRMRCVSCGLCALAAPAGGGTGATAASAWGEPWTFVVGASRSIDRADLVAAGTLDALPPERAAAAAAVCPMGVPIARMAESARSADGP